ncbi:MAG TPA: M23 family metallopeptidase [Candidatus Polarisedimenticolaceae bacterium]|nr:M23 family metallopeptidase [Candidatus Polarisedimenticolaceae bacterium]
MWSKLSSRLPRIGPGAKARFYTILILPHARSRFRKLHLSRAFVATCAMIALGVVGAGLYAPHLLLQLRSTEAAAERLQHENARLRAERDRFERTLAEIAGRLDQFESRSVKIADALGVDELPSSRPAAGGPVTGLRGPRRSLLDDELDALKSRSDTLDGSMDEIVLAFEERVRLLGSTPSILPAEGWFSHGYGWRKDPFTGNRQFHRGVDIVTDAGAPIVATADGIVSRAVRAADYGKTVDLSHGFGYVTRYGHMSEILVRPGQRVRRGDVIGRVGSTGRSTGPHLHYEVFRDGRRVNPWKYLGQPGK